MKFKIKSDDSFGNSFFLPMIFKFKPVEHYDFEFKDKFKMNVSLNFERSFSTESVGKYLFFNGKNNMVFGKISDPMTDVASINFLLPQDHVETAFIDPKSLSYGINLDFKVPLGQIIQGLYSYINLPIIYLEHDLQLTSNVSSKGLGYYQSGDFSKISNSNLNVLGSNAGNVTVNKDVISAFKGENLVGDVLEKWNHGIIDGKKSDLKIGHIKLATGFNAIESEQCNAGFELFGLLSGAKSSTAKYMFEPIVSGGSRHGVGGGLFGSYVFCKNENRSISAYLNGNISHLFSSNQRRSYDYQDCGVGSRYLLAKKFDANQIYSGEITNSINITSLDANIGLSAIYDANLMVSYVSDGLFFDVGTSLKGQTKEVHKHFNESISENRWALFDSNNAYAYSNNQKNNDAALSIKIDGSFSKGSGNLGLNGSGSEIVIKQNDERFISNSKLNKQSGLAPSAVTISIFSGIKNEFDFFCKPAISFYVNTDFSIDNASMHKFTLITNLSVLF